MLYWFFHIFVHSNHCYFLRDRGVLFLKIMIKKFLLGASLVGIVSSASAYDYSSYTEAFSTADYRTAINMGLKFFGGQRCGDTHNWMLVNNPDVRPKNCHTEDGTGSVNGGANGNYDLTGGWHDCGDHIKVATTMGYAAVSLLVAYDLWPQAFQDNYDGAYGSPNGIADVLDEAKIATDYFIKCFPDANTFVYYIGCPGDHNAWVTSSRQSSFDPNLGGDPRPISLASDKGGPQAANYASALALMAMKYPEDSYRAKCKEYAVLAYAFAKRNKSSHAAIPNFYGSPNPEWTDELALSAMLLYRLTGDESYKQDAHSYLNGKGRSNYPLAWDTMADFAYYYMVKDDPTVSNGQGALILNHMVQNVEFHLENGKKDPNGFPYVNGQLWGTNKLACGAAAATSLLVKLIEDKVVDEVINVQEAKNFITRVVDYMLGKNEFNHTFLHGYKGDMTFRIHHRNAMGRNDNPPTDVKNSCDYKFASGGLIGGPSGTGKFSNIVEGGSSFQETEGGCDYNAPFIMAIARIAAEKDPSQFGTCVQPSLSEAHFSVYPTIFDDYVVVDQNIYAGDDVVATLVTLSGVEVKKVKVDAVRKVMEMSDVPAGNYVLQVASKGVAVGYKVMKK